MPRHAVAAAAALAAVLAGGAVARAGDPHRHWRTYETRHFVVSYYAPLDDVARRVAVVAERAHANLAAALGHEPTEKCQIVLLDDTDGANGFADVLPRNAITLFATAPSGSSNLDDDDDWLYDLVSHEYTHIIHLDTIGGLPRIVNGIVGKTWSPNQIQPRWVIEGLAVYEESKRSAAGRNRSTTFDMYLRVPLLEGKQLRLDEVSGGPLRFPQGNAAYLYGSHFLRYVFDRFGDDTARKMSHVFGSDPIPFGVNRQIEQVTGHPFTELYDDWLGYQRDRAALQLEAVERAGRREGRPLTTSGTSNLAPFYSPDGKDLVWLQNDGWTQPRLRAMPVGGDARSARDLFDADRMGAFAVGPDGSIVFEQTWSYRQVYNYQDLMRWDPATGKTVRLTRAARARDPAISPDGRWVAFSQNDRSQSTLAVVPIQPGGRIRTVWRGARFDQAYAPVWSPDGTRIAFSAWRAGGYRDLLIADCPPGAGHTVGAGSEWSPEDCGKVTELSHDRAIDADPVWSPDGRWLFYDSDRTGISNVFARDMRSGALWQVTNVVGGAFEPSVSRDGRRLAYHAFTTNGYGRGGYDVFEIALDPAAWTPAEPYVDDRPPPTVVPDDSVRVDGPRPYRALETLAPLSFTAQLSVDSFGRAVSVQTGGRDVAGLMGWDLAATVGLERGDVSFGADYAYGGFRPSLRVAGTRSIVRRAGYRIAGLNNTYLAEVLAGTASIGLPAESRADRSWSAALDYNFDHERMVKSPFTGYDPDDPLPRPPLLPITYSGVSLRVAYGDARGFNYALGPQTGQDASLSVRVDHPALGADYKSITVSYAYRLFRKLPWGETPTFALRLVGGIHDGELSRPGYFALGGLPQQDVVQSILDNSRAAYTGYLHGFKPRTVSGAQYHLLNLEYRSSILDVERGLGTLPVYVKRLHFAGLLDVGTAFERHPTTDDVKVSVGGALRLDALFGYFVPGSFEVGYAHGLTRGGVGQTWLLLTGTL
jgi:Tol biopolymer transport system component